MDEGKKIDEEKVRELVGSILSHPSFHETLNNMFNVSSSTSLETPIESSQQANDHTSHSQLPTRVSLQRSNSSTATSNRYATPAEEFSSLFRRGSSHGITASATFQRGVSHRHSNQQGR